MKYKSFRNLVFLGGAIIAAGTCYFGFFEERGNANTDGSEENISKPSALDQEPIPFVSPENPISSFVAEKTVSSATLTPESLPKETIKEPVLQTALAPSNELREVDKMISSLLKEPAASEKIKDAFPREVFKVNVYRDEGHSTWNRIKVDLDRDEKWDEKWDLDKGSLHKRHVSSQDDETYNQEYRWRAGRWVPK